MNDSQQRIADFGNLVIFDRLGAKTPVRLLNVLNHTSFKVKRQAHLSCHFHGCEHQIITNARVTIFIRK